jgi:hypothetical protein
MILATASSTSAGEPRGASPDAAARLVQEGGEFGLEAGLGSVETAHAG